jgi:ABC-type uncharacterized transport system ATPase subunit
MKTIQEQIRGLKEKENWLAIKEMLIVWFPEIVLDEPLSGSDAVDRLCQLLVAANINLSKE